MPLSSFNRCGHAAGVRRGKAEIRRQVAAMRRDEKIALRQCMCGRGYCQPDCVICLTCWKSAPGEAKRAIYSRDLKVRQEAAQKLLRHAFTHNANYQPEPTKLAL